MKVSEHTILITGGSSGIGLAFAEKFLELGNTVIICGRNRAKLEQAKQQLPMLHTRQCDLTSAGETRNMVGSLTEEFPQLSVVVNNAGIQHNYRFTDDADHWPLIEEEVNANFTAHLRLADALLPQLLSQDEAAIINVSSALSRVPKASAPVYCATKAGIHIFSKALRYQLEATPVKLFEVVPALVDTAMTAGRGKGKISPARVADELIGAMRSDRYYIKVGKTKILMALHRLLPSLADRIIRNN